METVSLLVAAFVLNAVWQVALVVAAAALAGRILRGAPARAQHWIWVLALALAVALPLVSVRDRWPSKATVLAAPLTTDLAPAKEAPSPARGPVVRFGSGLPGAVAAAYAILLLGGMARLGRRCWTTNRIRASARPHPLPGPLRRAVERCAGAMHVSTAPILGSPLIAGPVTLGAWEPVILLPNRMFSEVSAPVLISALGHELAHIRRCDFLLQAICELLYLPIAFHPAAALLKRSIEETRELACDEMVAGRLLDGSVYAQSLVGMAAAMCRCERPGYSLGVLDSNILERRIRRLTAGPRAARSAGMALGAATFVLAASAMTASVYSIVPLGLAGRIHGTVYDPAGARVPGATVAALNLETGQRQTTVSDEIGHYFFPSLPDGHYRLEIRGRGFRLHRLTGVMPGSAADAVLKLGTVREVVTVHGS